MQPAPSATDPARPGGLPGASAPGGLAAGAAGTGGMAAGAGGTDPGARRWHQALGRIHSDAPLSLALRLPVCAQTCWHCSGSPRLQGAADAPQHLLRALGQDLEWSAEAGAARAAVVDVQFAGGGVNMLGAAQLAPLVHAVRQRLAVTASAPWSVTADPRWGTPAEMAALRGLGFETLVLSVADLDPAVQAATGRLVSTALLDDVVQTAWRQRWRQVQFNLVCGLPAQQPDGWQRTLEQVLALGPTRIRCMPARRDARAYPAQQALLPGAWPPAASLPALWQVAVQTLSDADYVPLGHGLWVLEDDPWLRAAERGWLTAGAAGPVVGPLAHRLSLGPGGRSEIGGERAHNVVDPATYIERCARGLPGAVPPPALQTGTPAPGSLALWAALQDLALGQPVPSARLQVHPDAAAALVAAERLGWLQARPAGWVLTDAGANRVGALHSAFDAWGLSAHGWAGDGEAAVDLHALVALATTVPSRCGPH